MRKYWIWLAKMLVFCFLTSSISCWMYYYGFITPTSETYSIVLLVILIGFIAYNIHELRNLRFKKYRNKDYYKDYYRYSYAVYGVFILVTVVAYLLCGETVYAVLFNALKLATFLPANLPTMAATMVTHAIMLAVIAIAPRLPAPPNKRARRTRSSK